jgi:hypothetical protein
MSLHIFKRSFAALSAMLCFMTVPYNTYAPCTVYAASYDSIDYHFANAEWETTSDKIKASWIASDKDQTYTITLYRRYKDTTERVKEVTTKASSYDFTRSIKGQGSGTYYFTIKGSKSNEILTSDHQEFTRDELKNKKGSKDKDDKQPKSKVLDYRNPFAEPDKDTDCTLNSEYSQDKHDYSHIDAPENHVSVWQFTPAGYIYYDKTGAVVQDGWKLISKHWYHFSDGFMDTNKWIKNYDGERYVGKNGQLYVNTVTPDGHAVNDIGLK